MEGHKSSVGTPPQHCGFLNEGSLSSDGSSDSVTFSIPVNHRQSCERQESLGSVSRINLNDVGIGTTS